MSKQLILCSYFIHDEENQTPKIYKFPTEIPIQ